MRDVFPELKMPCRGKGNNRQMFGGSGADPHQMMTDWLEIRQTGNVKPGKFFEKWDHGPILSTDEMSKLKGLQDDVSDVFYVELGNKKQRATAGNINIILKEAADQYDKAHKTDAGKRLMDFYRVFDDPAVVAKKGNNNYAYVFRLAAASRWLQATRAGISQSYQPIQAAMGHSSTRHTSRYFSNLLFDYSSIEDAFKIQFKSEPLARFMDEITVPETTTSKGKVTPAKKLFLDLEPAGIQNQDNRSRLRSRRTEFLMENIAEIDPDDVGSATVPTLQTLVPDNITDPTARLLHKIEQLESFMYYIDDVIVNKSFIQKEYGGTPAQVTEAKKAISILRSWRQPVIDASNRIAMDINDPAMPVEAIQGFTNSFSIWQGAVMAEQLSRQAGFAALSARGGKAEYLSSKIPIDAINAFLRTAPSAKFPEGQLRGTVEAKVARMSQEELDVVNKALKDKKEYVFPDNAKQRIRPGMKGLAWDVADPAGSSTPSGERVRAPPSTINGEAYSGIL